jgi:nitrous oxidase accessory protein
VNGRLLRRLLALGGLLIGLTAALIGQPVPPLAARPSAAPPLAAQASDAPLVVAPGSAYPTIEAALAVVTDGGTIEVHPGTYAGPLRVARSITLRGVGWPVIDGGGHGTVVTLAAPATVMRGFVVRGSGSDLNAEDAGIAVRAARVTLAENRLDDVLTGITLDNAPQAVVRGNHIRGKLTLPSPARGDGLKLWYSSAVLVEGNHVEETRDCVIWYSADLRMIGNTIERGRYGLHFMYDDRAELVGNVLRHNSVGAYLMYSRDVLLRGNLLAANRGPSGFGLGLKDVDDLRAEQNWLVDNRVGVWIDNSPTSLTATSRFERNVIAANDIALMLQPSTERNIYLANSFRDNLQQISLMGGGMLRANIWTERGRGNYWSDYTGFDADGDGLGDVPYRAEGLVADLMDRQPSLRLFQYGLASSAIEFAARAFPILRPAPRLTDGGPLMAPPEVPLPPGQAIWQPAPALGGAVGLLVLAVGLLALSRVRPARVTGAPLARDMAPALAIDGLTRRFGSLVAVDKLSLTLAAGSALALWGPNGAGKTTALRCILGLLPCDGQVQIAGLDARRHGPRARRALGYVPQEVALHDDLSLLETLTFYARLKGVPLAEARPLLDELGLTPHAAKSVGALSGGLRQRLALTLALLGDPPLLILDEPLANLDAASRDLVVRLVDDRRRRGTAILVTSHRLEEIEALADRVVVLEHGRLRFSCPSSELADRLNLGVTLRLRLAPERWPQALAILSEHGLTASQNGRSLLLVVAPTAKVVPLRLLAEAGIPVDDFSLEESVRLVPGRSV